MKAIAVAVVILLVTLILILALPASAALWTAFTGIVLALLLLMGSRLRSSLRRKERS